MNSNEKTGEAQPHSFAAQLDQACDAFEAAWNQHLQPRIEDYLSGLPPAQQPAGFRELLIIELQLRLRDQETPSSAHYHGRFPEFRQAIDEIFDKTVPRQRLGDYELLEKIGHGGMGIVYRARQILLNQTVALKVLPERFLDEPQVVSRFRREMQLIGGLEHPNIVRAYNAGEAGGVHFLVMEYVHGTTFQQLGDEKRLPVGAATELIRQAALGLQYAHDHGLVHRDIKPANLMLSRCGTVKILDLGLARFHAAQWSQGLTEAGMAMGTMDYMAPEQWENPKDVDIRADIYSLGCTLYFLLTGRPPYDEPIYDTYRRKLLAHATAPIPSIVLHRPECAEDLDKILSHMLAKEAHDRFDTPAEVAETLALFANAAEVSSLVPKESLRGRAAAASDPGLRSSNVDTRRTPSGPVVRRAKLAKERRPFLSRANLLAAGVAVSLLVMGIAGALYWRMPHGQSPQSSSGPSILTEAEAQKLGTEIRLLPGLNGPWWFDEMPWLTPYVRQAAAQMVTQHSEVPTSWGNRPGGYLNPNVVESQQWLLDLVSQCRGSLTTRQGRLLDELLEISRDRLTDDLLGQRIARSLARFTEDMARSADAEAGDLHTQAVLQHKLAALRNDRNLAEQAAATYQAALDRYQETGGPPAPLRLLCLADSARLYCLVLSDYDEGRSRFEQVIAASEGSVLLRAESLAACGAAAATAGMYEDSTFTLAFRLLEDSELGRQKHPLLAHVCERYAWSLMDQWKVREAYEQFLLAYSLRSVNRRGSKNRFALIYELHNQHGQAMTQRYCGNVAMARAQYDVLLKEIRAALDEAERQQGRPGEQRYRRDLRERWSNSLERRADCELYEGAASDPASVNLPLACQYYQQARDSADDAGAAVAMACKRCIALALGGNWAMSRQEFGRAEISQVEVIGTHQERVSLLRQLAEAVLALNEKGRPAGHAALRQFLRQFDRDPDYPDRHRRETQELQLLCAELLVGSELATTQPADALRDLEYLDKLVSAFRSPQQMLPYLRRYYQLAIRTVGPTDPNRVASYVLASRVTGNRNRLTTKDTSLALFHFNQRDGLAILLPVDAEGQFFSLDFGREQIKQLRQAGGGPPTLRLPEALVKTVQQQLASGHRWEVSWSDTMCWSTQEYGLSDQDWPFAGQLKLEALGGTPPPRTPR